MRPINLTCPHCLQHFFFEHLFHLYYPPPVRPLVRQSVSDNLKAFCFLAMSVRLFSYLLNSGSCNNLAIIKVRCIKPGVSISSNYINTDLNLKKTINGNKQERMIIKKLFEGPVGDYCIARNTIKCLLKNILLNVFRQIMAARVLVTCNYLFPIYTIYFLYRILIKIINILV